MKIIILGAGQVGSSVAENLAGEDIDITVVDQDAVRLASLQERLDIRVVVGHAAHPDVLVQAGIEDADLVLAVTNSDETNMVGCQIAHSLFQTPTRLARIRSASYLARPDLFSAGAVPINFIISPEELVAAFIERLIEYPGALQIVEFGDQVAEIVVVQADKAGAVVGLELRALVTLLPNVEVRVIVVYRQEQAILADGDTVIEPGDEVFFLAARADVAKALRAFRTADKTSRRITIAGGGNIGKRLAQRIANKYRVKIIEHHEARCRHLAETLHRVIVLQGDAASEELLKGEDIADTDVFCALTSDDAANILSAMLAKKLGARKVVSIINRASYVDLAQGAAVDVAVSPAQVTIGALLAYVRRGDVVAVHSLRRGAAEAIEIIAHGNQRTSKVVGKRLGELKLPQGAVVGAILRGKTLVMAHHNIVIESEDHVVVFLVDKHQIVEIERLFQVAVTFL